MATEIGRVARGIGTPGSAGGVEYCTRAEDLVGSSLCRDDAVGQHDDSICRPDLPESMCDHQRRATAGGVSRCALEFFGLVAARLGGGLVEDCDLGVREDETGQGNLLSLSFAQLSG